MKRLILLLVALAASAFSQTTSTDGASNSFLAALETVGSGTSARQLYVYLTISYPDSAVPEDYVDAGTLRQDVSFVVQNVSNKNAPLEVFAAATASALLGKYPQTSSIAVQVLYQPQTLNQQSASAQKTRAVAPKTSAATAKK